MGRFTVGIIGYGTNPVVNCFEEVARAVRLSLIELGHEVPDHTDSRPGRLIMLGANNIVDPHSNLPADAICFNNEQLGAPEVARDPRWQMGGAELYKKRVVWDYSGANLASLKKLGIERVVLCPVGYHPSMTKAEIVGVGVDEDIDVLFYGSLNDRRVQVIKGLRAMGLNVHVEVAVRNPDGSFKRSGCWGEERDALIARAKVVLNMHYYAGGIFEIFRCAHLFANKKCVVTEMDGVDGDLESLAARCARVGHVQDLVGACFEMVVDADARRAQAERGYEEFRKTNMRENVRRAVEAS